uniref:cell wall protein DAN4-like n=1 Tax=Solea senegalensis TaxID=28829 RepID=UPI001CD90F61|nr:cell wall protein DAN4-like [Solea senegalensis]
MMKRLLSLALIVALSSTAGALVCQNCTDDYCTSPVPRTCDTETMCITAAITAVSSGTPGTKIFKACASSSLCPVTGSQTFSVNLGVSSALASATCCDSDNCNSATLSFPTSPSPNSLLCYVCYPATSLCTTSITCNGTEDRCFQASLSDGATTSRAFGCASTNMCAASASLGTLPFMKDVGSITSGSACCATNLCNTLTATTAAPTTNTTVPTTTNTSPTTTTAPTTTTTTTTTASITTTTAPTTAMTTATTTDPTTTTAAGTATTIDPTTAAVSTTAPTTTTSAAATATNYCPTTAMTTATTTAPTTTTAAGTATTTAPTITTTAVAPATTGLTTATTTAPPTTAATTATTIAPTTAATTATTIAPTTALATANNYCPNNYNGYCPNNH